MYLYYIHKVFELRCVPSDLSTDNASGCLITSMQYTLTNTQMQ